jgi:uncharacterized membrane protein
VSETEHSHQPSTEEVLAEVERRRTPAQPVRDEHTRRIVIALDHAIFWLTKHWVAVLNTLAFLYIGIPFLAPLLMLTGSPRTAHIIYLVYRPMCHQLPQRSWFLGGVQAHYSLMQLADMVGSDSTPEVWSRDFVGTPSVGYKVALCQRDVAIYGTIVLVGLLYGVFHRRIKIRPLKWWLYVVFGVLPMLVDGGYQWLSYLIAFIWPSNPYIQPHETTPLLRTITGALFGAATIWLAYPYVEATMDEFQQDLRQRFGWE